MSIVKLMKVCVNTLNNDSLDKLEREECFRILETLIKIIYTEKVDTTPSEDPIELLMNELDLLRPLSFFNMNSVPFFIVKSWLRL